MAKKMTSNETWKKCMSVWGNLARKIRKLIARGEEFDVDFLKDEWCKNNGFENMDNDCFFCEYQKNHKTQHSAPGSGCRQCPASKIDPKFDCLGDDYHYAIEPIAFYNKLRALNRKRLKKVK